MKKIIILVSGNGSNMESIIKSCQNKSIHDTEVTLVISNKNNALALKKANNLGVKTKVLENACFPCRELYDQELLKIIKQYDCDLIILAGFMRILTHKFIDAFKNKIINIHPSLLPKFPGLHTHKRAIENNELYHGTTIHYVIPELDAGPIIFQQKFKIEPHDCEQTLYKKVQQIEHQLYPKTINLLLNKNVSISKMNVKIESIDTKATNFDIDTYQSFLNKL